MDTLGSEWDNFYEPRNEFRFLTSTCGMFSMIERIEFQNFKALRNTVLPLGRFTLIVGPNGSGKSTALEALQLAQTGGGNFAQLATAGGTGFPSVTLNWAPPHRDTQTELLWPKNAAQNRKFRTGTNAVRVDKSHPLGKFLANLRIYSLIPERVAQPVDLVPQLELGQNGSGLAGVLDRLRDTAPERFDALNVELNRWLPEFDRILFDTPGQGQRAFALRTQSGHVISARDLSDGTLLALAILALAYLPDPPPLVAFEDPDRGLHPRLLREVQDALYRLAYPENYGEEREPVQVIATTHSPYFLDLYRDHPEEIVIAEKHDSEATFERLADRSDIHEILQDASLGEVWYSGILGGVPVEK